MGKKISVLVVDDSATVRQVVSGILSKDPEIRVMAVASDPLFAMEHMKKEWPDVITLDVEMPRMDGISFLKHLMATRPVPVVVCSSLTASGAETTMQALAAGAISIVTKPKLGVKQFLEDSSANLVDAVKAAAQANMKCVRASAASVATPQQKLTADAILPAGSHAMAQTTERIVAIGTSTGGTQALESVLTALPRVSPGMVIVQHMPEKFTAAFAERLNSVCAVEVVEAKHNDRVIPGRALVAPGGRHMLLKRSGAQYYVEVIDGPLVNRHRPSVDVLFRSVAKFAGPNALGIIMTGMGDDGAVGLLEMRQAGARTIGQDEATCVVYGMPKEAVKRGAVQHLVPLNLIPTEVGAFG
ncbi:MAG: chemotaxis response regulator protein-glutamate methylesterase [Nitrospira sp.]|nr:chemotaxis response regulator protein-glutamate methylesterase [Nitrospira sp.]